MWELVSNFFKLDNKQVMVKLCVAITPSKLKPAVTQKLIPHIKSSTF
jgi:hypothetical protein